MSSKISIVGRKKPNNLWWRVTSALSYLSVSCLDVLWKTLFRLWLLAVSHHRFTSLSPCCCCAPIKARIDSNKVRKRNDGVGRRSPQRHFSLSSNSDHRLNRRRRNRRSHYSSCATHFKETVQDELQRRCSALESSRNHRCWSDWRVWQHIDDTVRIDSNRTGLLQHFVCLLQMAQPTGALAQSVGHLPTITSSLFLFFSLLFFLVCIYSDVIWTDGGILHRINDPIARRDPELTKRSTDFSAQS